MITSRRFFLALAGAALPAAVKQKFAGPLGLQLYSLRREAEEDLPGTLALIRKMGFQEMEAGAFYGRTPSEFRRLSESNGLKITSTTAEWPELSKGTAEAADRAHVLGASYVMCSNIPRKKRQFTIDDVTRAADNFNQWGEELARAGLQFCYHAHGFEFRSGPDGTLFDALARRLNPKAANFEMDVFWIHFGGQDPAQLLERYPGRFPLMHLKDIRKGEPKTGEPGDVAEEASVPLGTGEIDWPGVLRAAIKTGVRRYYIEEEHPNAVNQIPETLYFLKNVTF